MDDTTKRLIDTFEKDFHELSAKGAWTKEDLEKMKDLQKLMYYLEVRCAMKDGGDYPGEEYMEGGNGYDGYNNSYANRRGGSNRRSMNSMPYYYDNGMRNAMSGRRNYNMSGRRYYDSEHDKFMGDLHKMMGMENDPETREAMERVVNLLENR